MKSNSTTLMYSRFSKLDVQRLTKTSQRKPRSNFTSSEKNVQEKLSERKVDSSDNFPLYDMPPELSDNRENVQVGYMAKTPFKQSLRKLACNHVELPHNYL